MMISEFATAVEAIGQGANVVGDERIPDGVQWHVALGRDFRLPAGPVVLHHCTIEVAEQRGPDASVSTRQLPAEVTPRSPLALFPIRWSGRKPCWVEVIGEGRLRVAVTAPRLAPNRRPVELAAVDEPPYKVGSFAMGGVLVTGEGRVDDLRVWFFDAAASVETRRLSIEALPDDYLGKFATYALPMGGNQEDWEERIRIAAPMIEVPYAPVSPDPSVNRDTEFDRVTRLVGTEASVDAWLRRAYGAFDVAEDDLVVVDEPESGDYPVRARHRASESLSLAAIDPGVSRWLGRTGTVGAGLGDGPDGLELLVAQVPGLFFGSAAAQSDFGGGPGEMYNGALDGGWATLLETIESMRDPNARWAVQAKLLNVPIAVVVDSRAARPQAPDAGLVGPPNWVPDVAGGVHWRQAIALRGIAPTGPVALEQVAPGERATLHPLVDETVAAPMAVAWSPTGGPATVTATVPVEGDGELPEVVWRLHVGDWTGRWSDPVELTGIPPARPIPGPCSLEAWYTPTDSLPTGHVSTGTVRLAISFAPVGLPGSVPVDRIEWAVDGFPEDPIVLSPAQQVNGLRVFRDFHAPETSPGGSSTVGFTATAVDVREGRSVAASVDVLITDPRPLPAPRIAPRLMPTSRPTADPEVSITLTASGVPDGGAVRFWFANETAVRAALGMAGEPDRETPRYERADGLRQAGGGSQRAYSAALREPVRAVGGRATATLRFPAGSNDLILVRAVPVAMTTDAAGIVKETASTPFAATRPAFVIVPTSDVPGVASVRARAKPNGTVTVDVRIPAVSTERFGQAPPEARVVQVIDGMPPAYWPEVGQVLLDRRQGDELTGRVSLPAPEWARIGLAASVRFPAEPLLAPGAVVEPGDLSAAGPAAASTVVRSQWGAVSAPAWVDLHGPNPRVEASAAADGSWTVEVQGLPPARAGLPGFTAELYRGADALVLESEHALDADRSDFVAGPFPGSAAAVVLVDPFGARGPVVELPS
ncbi:MAG: hypothetical protein K0S05_1888 [Agromyces sp.]|nr:hypothetical protein [Agromyces sp.]